METLDNVIKSLCEAYRHEEVQAALDKVKPQEQQPPCPQCPNLTNPTNTTYFYDGMTHLSYLGAQTAAAFIQPFIIYYITH